MEIGDVFNEILKNLIISRILDLKTASFSQRHLFINLDMDRIHTNLYCYLKEEHFIGESLMEIDLDVLIEIGAVNIVVRMQWRGERKGGSVNAYIYCLNDAIPIVLCVQGGGVVKF